MTDSNTTLLRRATAAAEITGLPNSDLHKAEGIFGAFSPAFNGCLLALVREAWKNPDAGVSRHCRGAGTSESTHRPAGSEETEGGGWVLLLWGVDAGRGDARGLAGFHDTEAEALVAALESAPR